MGTKHGINNHAPIAERFWARVHRAGHDECWIWFGPVAKNG